MGSTVAITLRSSIIAALGVSGTAGAQDAANSTAPNVEEIVVTGSSLRGVAPVGSNLVTVGRDDIENTGAQTVQQILKTVPSVVGLQSAGQAAYGSFDGAGTNAPTIHGLGASASNSTLILLNGHRMPVSGINHVLADPNIVAPLALERVEVLADGASSVYGSDAVAGVVNFITRRNVDGFEASLQTGRGRRATERSTLGVLGGTTWDGGSLLVSYNYSDRDNLEAIDRDYVRANQTARGGRDFTPNRCGPASITVGTPAQTFYTPYTARGRHRRRLRSVAARGSPRQRDSPQHFRDDSARRQRSADVDRRFDLLRTRERSSRAARQRERHDVRPGCGQRWRKSVRSSVCPRVLRRVRRPLPSTSARMRCSAPALTSRATSNGLRAFRRRLRAHRYLVVQRRLPRRPRRSRGNRTSASSAARASTWRSTARRTAAAAPRRRRFPARRQSCSIRR